jgi:predicted naringenin-chalcone synthase
VSKCPSTRSPHPIRTGSITWQLNQGVPREVVSQRCNTDQIEEFYDKPDEDERWRRYHDQMERQRRQHVDSLDLPHDD